MNKPMVGITMGDPAGVGPELCLKAIQDSAVLDTCVPVIFGDISVLERVAGVCNLVLPSNSISLSDWQANSSTDAPLIINCNAIDAEVVQPGEVSGDCGKAAYCYIEAAITAAMKGDISAIITAPINKESLASGGIQYPGHTEILASLCETERVCMMMASDSIVVSLATIHVGYADVPGLITESGLINTIELTWDTMRKLGKEVPRLTVCGLNPHAGEGGLFGDEEAKLINPVVLSMRERGMHIEGPLPADTAFIESRRAVTDAYIVMYHDQGLVPFKMLAFDEGVNITLGLPIIRTSVDHGTAFDIAWQGKASASSLISAISWAQKLS